MKHLATPLAILLSPALAFAANAAPVQPRAGTAMPAQQSMINLSLVDALVAVHEEKLAGIFGFVADQNAAPAFADYLFRNPKALKLFLKKGEADLKRIGGVNEWDKQVYLYIVTIQANASLVSDNALSPKIYDRVTTLSLAPGVSLAAIKMGGRR